MLHHLNSEQQISWKKGYEIIHFFVGEKIKEKKKCQGTQKDFTEIPEPEGRKALQESLERRQWGD